MKDAFYYPHYIGARNDNKIFRLRLKHGMSGYGIYFAILEILREQNDHKYPLKDRDLLVADLRIEVDILNSVIDDFDLFKKDKTHFWSPRLIQYLEPYYVRKEAAIKAGKASANQRKKKAKSTNVEQTLNDGSTINKEINKQSNSYPQKNKNNDTTHPRSLEGDGVSSDKIYKDSDGNIVLPRGVPKGGKIRDTNFGEPMYIVTVDQLPVYYTLDGKPFEKPLHL
jgi:hypothetical protein